MVRVLDPSIEWRVDPAPVPYRAALVEQEARNAAIAAGEARELVWLLEHPPVYTAGTSAAPRELLDPRFEVIETGRGGRYTTTGRASGSVTCCST
jgi:lipoyl(octanoyl) transferase